MSDEKLGSFKIGDSHREGMSPPAARTSELQKSDQESFSLGFARIEKMLEEEDPVQVGESLNTILQDLEQLQQAATTNKDKLAVQKAIAAVEKTVDLMDFLYQTKDAMVANASK